jgi:carboxylesterase
MRYLGERLADAGLRCLGPVLPGHGGDPRALIGMRWVDWCAGAERELVRLRGARRRVVIGCSMGALVSCWLAHEHPGEVDALVLLAPALRLAGTARVAAFLGRRRAVVRLLPMVPKLGSDVRDREMARRNPEVSLSHVPLPAVSELQDFGREVDRMLPGIAARTLVIHGARDHTVALSGARRIARRIGSGPARLVVLPQSQHLVGIDVERDACAAEVLSFIEQVPVYGARSA